MAMRDRYLTFDGVNLKDAYGLIYSSFSEKLPEPKVVTVDIPAGTDLDITAALGPVGWHNGTHVLRFLLYGGTQAGRLEKLRDIKALMHGVRASYTLSWDSYTYTGRATVEVEHRTEEADLVTITIDRSPWKVGTRESHVVDCHPEGSYTLEGSKRFHTVRAKLLQGGYAEVAVTEPSILANHRNAGTYTLADDAYHGETVWLDLDDWVMYVDGDDLVVNSYSISGSNFVVNSTYTVTDGDIYFADADKQLVTVDFYRWDV